MLSSLKNRGKGNAFFLIDKSFEVKTFNWAVLAVITENC